MKFMKKFCLPSEAVFLPLCFQQRLLARLPESRVVASYPAPAEVIQLSAQKKEKAREPSRRAY